MTPATPAATHPRTYGSDASIARFSVARYQRMIESGALDDEDKVELLEGYVVLKMPRNPRHDSTVQRVQSRLYRAIPAGWDVRTQLAITLPDSQPEPDLAVVRGDAGRYVLSRPEPPDVGLLVEVSDTSLARDTQDKTRIYGAAGVAAYWVVNLVDRRVEVYTGPTATGYSSCAHVNPGDAIPLLLAGAVVASVPVSDLIG